MSVFYETYGISKGYATPSLSAKHIRRFDREVWEPAAMRTGMRCLEIGCGTGLFLSYLAEKGLQDIVGIDLDPSLSDVIPENVRDRFRVSDAATYLAETHGEAPFERIFMFDVLEHFSPDDGRRLLLQLKDRLSPAGAVVLKMPNAGSPWGQQFQHGDLTHLTGYTPESVRQMATAVGMRCEKCYPHLLGSPSRQLTDRFLQRILNRLVATPPEIWEGNFFAILIHTPE